MWTLLTILTLRFSAGKDDDCKNCCHDNKATCESADGCVWWEGYTTCWPDEGKDKDKDGDWGDKDDWEKKTATTGQTKTLDHSWNGDMHTRSYISVMPPNVSTGLVVVLLSDGAGCALGSLAERLGVVVICPVAKSSGWIWDRTGESGDAEDVDFIATLIGHVETKHSIPGGKVIVTGFSAGGSMAYRVGCERSQVIGGLVIYGQTFLDPAVGHIGKDEEESDRSVTEMVLERMTAVRETNKACAPAVSRPHYAMVGLQDNYYGEEAGAYRGEALWEFYSTQVLGCSGAPVAAPVVTLGSCRKYEACEFNRYCTVPGMEHTTDGWEDFVASAFNDFFKASENTKTDASAAFLLTPESAGLSSAMLVLLLRFA